ncbi:MAG: DEAD/DEAH box helicase, partial [Desulfurococcaceae archaeon]
MIELKPLINTLLKQLDALTHVLEEKGYLGWYIGEVSRLRGIISGAKTPHVPSRTLWDRYTFILTAIEEVAIVAKKAGYDFALYSMITSLREQVIEFKSALERAYTLEKIQVSMPVVLGISLVIFKTINSASTLSWIYYAISIISIISALINPVLSLIGTGFLGVMMMLIEGDASGLLTGSLLLFVSALYVYLLYMSKSSKFEKKVEEFKDFFKRIIGHEPWTLQTGWARRIFSNQSFVALAPTGVGKTTTGMIISLFLDKKSYIITPTKILSKFIKKRLDQINELMNLNKKILLVADSKSKNLIDTQEYDILITTSMFLARNEEKILQKRFDFIFVDDVDSYLRQPKNVERVLKLMGLSNEDLNELKSILKRKYELIRDKNNSNKYAGFSEISNEISKIRKKINGILVLSSATAKARANTIRYFRELFGFEISPQTSALRNIVDSYLIKTNDKKE